MSAEATQEQGRRSVSHTKRWLEATTYVELPFNVYQNEPLCQVELLSGSTKRFDLYGFMLGENSREVYVENKDYSSSNNLYAQYLEFLAHAYSATARTIKATSDRKAEFMWVTTHPFQVTQWTQLSSHQEVLKALQQHPEVLGEDDEPDEELARTVADRIWVLVLNKRQLEISLTTEEVGKVLPVLARKESTL